MFCLCTVSIYPSIHPSIHLSIHPSIYVYRHIPYACFMHTTNQCLRYSDPFWIKVWALRSRCLTMTHVCFQPFLKAQTYSVRSPYLKLVGPNLFWWFFSIYLGIFGEFLFHSFGDFLFPFFWFSCFRGGSNVLVGVLGGLVVESPIWKICASQIGFIFPI